MEYTPLLVRLVAREQGRQVVHIARRAEVVVHASNEQQDVGRLVLVLSWLCQVEARDVLGQDERPARIVDVQTGVHRGGGGGFQVPGL